MKRVYSFLRNSLPAFALTSGFLMYAGCTPLNSPTEAHRKEYEFTEFGNSKVATLDYRVAGIAVADFDGDGDIDIVVLNGRKDIVTIYENKMPQKGRTNVLETLEQR